MQFCNNETCTYSQVVEVKQIPIAKLWNLKFQKKHVETTQIFTVKRVVFFPFKSNTVLECLHTYTSHTEECCVVATQLLVSVLSV